MVIYPVIFLFAVFETFFMLLPYFNTARYDELMIHIDHAIFGAHPTVWLEAIISTPFTELMYLLYLFYFPMPLFILIWLYRKHRYADMERSFFVLLLTYYGAYVIYFFVPVEGPRYHLAELQSVPLDGLLFTEPIRRLIDFLEPNKLDCFPSLHAAITLATLLVTRRYHRTLFRWLLPAAAGIMLSLVYCRYHYAIDVAAGIVWAAACYWLANRFYDRVFHRFAPHFGRDGK
jgi:membrane-associated phospholipid phosphatase